MATLQVPCSGPNNKQKCPAYGKKCSKYGRENYFAVKCKAKPDQRWKKSVSTIATEYMSDECEDITCINVTDTEIVDAVETDSGKDMDPEREKNRKEDIQLLYAGMLLGKDMVKFQINCGASCNIIPINLLNPDTKLEQRNSALVMYKKSKLRPMGKCNIKIRNPRNHKQYCLEFQRVNADGPVPLLGRRDSEAMKLIKVHHTVHHDNGQYSHNRKYSKGSLCKRWTMYLVCTLLLILITGQGGDTRGSGMGS